jgi:hypothetical protein
MNHALSIAAIILSLNISAQKISDHIVELYPEQKKEIFFDDSLHREQLRKKYAGRFIFDGRRDDFVEENVKEMKELFSGSWIYSGHDEELEYLKRVFVKAIPARYHPDSVKLFIVRDPSINAFCSENGIILLTSGLLANLDNEAQLAGLFSHEYGHYRYEHAYKIFKKRENAAMLSAIFGIFNGFVIFQKYASDLRRFEKACDLTGIEFSKTSGYSANGCVELESKFLRAEKNEKRKKDRPMKFYLYRSHPITARRASYLKKQIIRDSIKPGLNFQVDSAGFMKLKKRACDEVIYYFFENGEYSDCMDMAYKLHLENPSDEFYIYFLFESLRRQKNLFPHLNDKLFLTWRYRLKNKESDNPEMEMIHNSIHFHLKEVCGLDDSIVKRHLSELNKDKNLGYYTNEQAYSYFFKLAKASCSECYPATYRVDSIADNSYSPKNELTSTLFDQTFPVANISSKKINTFFINNIYTSRRSGVRFKGQRISDSEEEKRYFTQYLDNKGSSYTEAMDSLVVFNPALTYREKEDIQPLLNTISKKVIYARHPFNYRPRRRHYFRDTKKASIVHFNAAQELPELYQIKAKYNLSKIFFVDFIVTRPGFYFRESAIRKKLNIFLYCVDLDRNVVYRYYKKHKFKYFGKPEYVNFFPDMIDDVLTLKKKLPE